MSEMNEQPRESAVTTEAARVLQARIAEIWHSAVGGLTPTAEQVSRGVSRLAHKLDVGPEEALKVFGEFSRRVRQDRDELERRIEQGVHHALAGMGLVNSQELESLEQRLDALNARVDEIQRKR